MVLQSLKKNQRPEKVLVVLTLFLFLLQVKAASKYVDVPVSTI